MSGDVGAVVGSDGGFVGDLGLDGQVAGVDGLAEEADEETVGEAGGTHPANVVGAQVGFGDDADGLTEEGDDTLVALGDGDEVEGGAEAFDEDQGGGGAGFGAVEVPGHGVPGAAGELDHGEFVEGFGGVGFLR